MRRPADRFTRQHTVYDPNRWFKGAIDFRGICRVQQELQMNTSDKPREQGNIFVHATSTINFNPLN
jgi:hypothetical protein